jgi:UDP-glucuronate decarboxylase
MRILVTGGAGFLGSHLTDRLVEQGHEITVLDNLQTGSMGNIAHFRGNQKITFQKQSIVEPFDGSFDRIYNLACPASPPAYQLDPIDTLKTNFYGVDNLLQLAEKCGARFFQASTSEIYGDPLVHPQPESYRGNCNPIGPRACYDEGKRIAETLCFDYWRMRKVPIKVVRIFNTYGPRMDPEDGRVVSNFIVQALQNIPITIYGDGSQTRSFCYVDDLIDGFMRLMESSEDITGPINIGNPGEFTVSELAKIVVEMTNSKSQIIYKDLPEDDPKVRRPDITLARERLGWEPKVPLKVGLKKTITYFEQRLRDDKTVQ